MYKIHADTNLFLHRHKVSIFNIKLMSVSLSYNFAFNNHITIKSLSLITGETEYQPTITDKCSFVNVTMFAILYYEYIYNTVCHNIF